jgi:hypothetical protein
MVNIFDYLKSILFTKKDLNIKTVEEENFDMYMVNRWCSMVDADAARIINETTNKFGYLLETKDHQYKLLQNILPSYKFRKINYIKRKTVD